jgi:hypothetical protein
MIDFSPESKGDTVRIPPRPRVIIRSCETP